MLKTLRLSLVLVITLLWSSTWAPAEVFNIAVVPDTQQETGSDSGQLVHRLNWLVAQKQALNLKMVLHVGDMTDWDTPDHAHFERFSTQMKILEVAEIPYALTLGNHDTAAVKVGGSAAPGNVNANLRITTTFNRYFPAGRFANLKGVYEDGKMDNAWHTFEAGDLKWLVVNLELWPRTKIVDWAKTVVESHPDHNVIVLTHSHLSGKSTIEQTKGGYGDNSPQYLFDNLMKPYANVRLVFSGHTGQGGYRADSGSNGNTVHQFVQCYHTRTTNPVRLVEIDTNKGTMTTRVYCPMTDETKPDGSVTVVDAKWVTPK